MNSLVSMVDIDQLMQRFQDIERSVIEEGGVNSLRRYQQLFGCNAIGYDGPISGLAYGLYEIRKKIAPLRSETELLGQIGVLRPDELFENLDYIAMQYIFAASIHYCLFEHYQVNRESGVEHLNDLVNEIDRIGINAIGFGNADTLAFARRVLAFEKECKEYEDFCIRKYPHLVRLLQTS